jgi:hypothetical protein
MPNVTYRVLVPATARGIAAIFDRPSAGYRATTGR